ncbi:MAG: GNAT family N-acetyltransferase [Bosea sp. (in: a-proteobacteria)]
MAIALHKHALQMNDTVGSSTEQDAPKSVVSPHGWTLAREALTPQLAAEWDALAAQGVASPYQSRLWVEGFVRHVSFARQDAHVLITMRDGIGVLIGLFPLIMRAGKLGVVASFVGEKHANFHMPLITPELIARLDTKLSHHLLKDMGKLLPSVDAFSFFNQPRTWNGQPTPLACLAAWNGTQPAYGLSLEPDAEAAMTRAMSKHARKNLRGKRRKLDEMGRIWLMRADSAADVARISDAFVQQKTERFSELGIEDPFTETGIMDFLRDGAQGNTPALVWHALMLDERVIATFVGAIDGRRYSGMATSFISDTQIGRYSPGEALVAELIALQAAEQRTVFDLGVGDARYKASFCDMIEPMVETVMPITVRGYGILAMLQLKRMAKQTGIVMQRRNPVMARLLRKLIFRSAQGA